MIGKVTTKDGQKIVEPISGSIPTGNPVGTLLTTYKKIQPRNYLYCDGSTFNASQYPALYLYLGSNVLPDYRECAMVGAEQNTTDTIATHDVYSQGEFKDDQFQGHIHQWAKSIDYNTSSKSSANYAKTWRDDWATQTQNLNVYNSDGTNGTPRAGTTTHGKQKAVYVYIKAVDGVDISDEDTFLVTVKNFVEEKNSYSTTEMLTGGKWIDGKPIYRKCGTYTSASSSEVLLDSYLTSALIDTVVAEGGSARYNNNSEIFAISGYNGATPRLCLTVRNNGLYKLSSANVSNLQWWIEYTKTTD